MKTSFRWLGAMAGLLVGCSDVASPPTVVSVGFPLIGGQPDTATRGVVGLVVSEASGCTGSLIAPNLVLTARHCVASINSSNGTVQCGVTNFGSTFPASAFIVTPDDNIRDGVPAGSQFGVARVVTTPGNGVCGNDVSLLVLSSNVASSTAPLLVPRVDAAVTTNESFDAVGYGITSPNDVQGETFGRRLRVNGLDVGCVGTGCANLGGTRTEWGAVTPVCSGDSGGPALDADGRVIGVASRGNSECDSALYGSVASWRSLIVDTAIDAADSGGYQPPGWAVTNPTDGGIPAEAGTPDSGAPDSGTPEPDAGNPQPDAGGTVGEPCNGSCPGGLVCYTQTEGESGICVPNCSNDTACPFRYVCSERLGICVPGVPEEGDDNDPKSNEPGDDDGGCGCRAAARPDDRGALALAFLMLASVLRRRRRANG